MSVKICNDAKGRLATLEFARFFVIRINEEYKANIGYSQRNNVWASSPGGSRRLSDIFKGRAGPIYLIFKFYHAEKYCGVAEMKSGIDERLKHHWVGGSWGGCFQVEWVENNQSVPVPTAVQTLRDSYEINRELGIKVMEEYLGVPPLAAHAKSALQAAETRGDPTGQGKITSYFKKQEKSAQSSECLEEPNRPSKHLKRGD